MSLSFACRAGSVAPTAGGGVSTAASLVAACKTRCAALLMLLGPLQPANGVAAAEHWLQQAGQVRECQQRCCLPPAWPAVRCHCACAIHTGFCCFWLQGGMPEEAHLALIDALVQCSVRAMAAQHAEAAKYGLIACRHLSGEEGIQAWLPKHHNGRALFAMRRVRQLVAAAAAAAEPARPRAARQGADVAPAPVQQLLAELVGVVDDCMVNLAEAEAKTGEQGPRQKLSSWQLRVALADALVALLRADPKLLQGDVRQEALSFLQGLLSDDSYTVRLAGTRLVQVGGWPCAVLLCLPCAAASCCAAAIAPRLAAAY